MTTTQTDRLMAMFDDAIKSSRLQGGTDAKKGFGIYTEEDSRFYVAMHKSIAEKRASLLAALQARNQQGPIKTWQQRLEETCPALGPMHIHASVEEVNDVMQAEIAELRSALQEQAREGEVVAIKDAVGCVLEGWTLPEPVRKILETAYYAAPQAAQPSEPAQPEQGPST